MWKHDYVIHNPDYITIKNSRCCSIDGLNPWVNSDFIMYQEETHMAACIQNNVETTTLNRLSNNPDYLSIPDALVTYARNTVFLVWQVLEGQLSQVDLALDPEMYAALEERAVAVFNAWMEFRYVCRGN